MEHEQIQAKLPKTRPQEPFYKRLNEIEKKAKALEQEREQSLETYDLNNFFEKKMGGAPGDLKAASQNDTFFSRQQSYNLDHNQSMDSQRAYGLGIQTQRLPMLPHEMMQQEVDIKFMSNIIKSQVANFNSSLLDATNILINTNQKDPQNQVVYISPDAVIGDDILHYYGIKQNQKDDPNKNGNLRGLISKNSQFKGIVDDFFERLDSRGKRIKIRRVHVL